MAVETKEQLELEAEIKAQAQKFLKYLNSNLPESMELEYEGFYRRGFFVSKKRYAVIEDGEIIGTSQGWVAIEASLEGCEPIQFWLYFNDGSYN